MARAAHEETASGPASTIDSATAPPVRQRVRARPALRRARRRSGPATGWSPTSSRASIARRWQASRISSACRLAAGRRGRSPPGRATDRRAGHRTGARWSFLRRKEEGAPQIWLLPAEGGEAAPLTSLRGGVAEFVWSPDGATIYCTSDVDPDAPPASAEREPPVPRVREVHEIYYRGDTIGWRGRTRRQIFAVAAAGGRARRLTRGDFQHRALAVSPDGEWLAFASDRSRRRHERAPWGAELCVMPAGGGRVRRLARDVVAVGGIAWRPGREQGEEQIAFVGAPEEQHLAALPLPARSRIRRVPAPHGRLDRSADRLLPDSRPRPRWSGTRGACSSSPMPRARPACMP